ncbi:MAG TPA: FG-GAP repeat protein, partial [Thermoleophilia bacterium]|nr:FG-GAP repeat protein [Thermoleophilia bacterium]
DGSAGDKFGYSVAISGDTALIGAPFQAVAGRTLPAPATSSRAPAVPGRSRPSRSLPMPSPATASAGGSRYPATQH